MPGPVDRMAGERIAQRCAALVGSVGLVLLFQCFAWLSEPTPGASPKATPISAPREAAPNELEPKTLPTSDEVVIHVERRPSHAIGSRRAVPFRGA